MHPSFSKERSETMILAYPYYKKGTIYYFVTNYDEVNQHISLLSWDASKNKFLKIYERPVVDGRFYIDYRPTREYTYISDMKPVEE